MLMDVEVRGRAKAMRLGVKAKVDEKVVSNKDDVRTFIVCERMRSGYRGGFDEDRALSKNDVSRTAGSGSLTNEK